MALKGPGDPSSIANHVQACFNGFQIVYNGLVNAELHIKGKLPPGVVNDEVGRFRLWCGNIGAHRSGRSSLDHRLREASHIRDQVLELLRDLITVLQEATDIITGERVSWEDLSDSESDLSEDGHEPEQDRSTTELGQLVSNVAEINTCLMRLSMAIRNPAPHDQFNNSSQIDVAHYESFDIEHVRGKFPDASEHLIDRLGKAISRRRQYLRYRQEHRERLAYDLEEQPQEIAIKYRTTVTAPSTKIKSTVASSIPIVVKASNSVIELSHNHFYEDVLSQTSYASSANDSIRLRPPQLPTDGQDGDPFECPLCFRFTSVRQVTAWHKHVYRDLQPYICTFEACEIPDRMYESRHEWFNHELQAHRTWWECIEGCNQPFQSPDSFREHTWHEHTDLASEERISDLMRSCERKAQVETEVDCALCQQKLPSLNQLCRHLAKHHEELSLFALPSHMKEDLPVSDDEEDNADSISLPSATDNEWTAPPLPVICSSCHLVIGGESEKKLTALTKHIREAHSLLVENSSPIGSGSELFIRARGLLDRSPSTVDSIDDKEIMSSLLGSDLKQRFGIYFNTWADLKRWTIDSLSASRSSEEIEHLRLLQAVHYLLISVYPYNRRLEGGGVDVQIFDRRPGQSASFFTGQMFLQLESLELHIPSLGETWGINYTDMNSPRISDEIDVYTSVFLRGPGTAKPWMSKLTITPSDVSDMEDIVRALLEKGVVLDQHLSDANYVSENMTPFNNLPSVSYHVDGHGLPRTSQTMPHSVTTKPQKKPTRFTRPWKRSQADWGDI
ncbi:hypothetical protein P153DRAFT_70755 [Dothidotthia symphoricarpi CBS 119687]|uniref:C2H2-type domain-containing protein n=1 Tax=Dothidotthia symphoricarpi CBS 119687 TaxID=1392245 RepID=A0A6A6A6W6_9PLEO|nr:uncharacterized protein P153DRAFT_70755 [Dothidotthia symphoricarpi CBS 119687]KAF2126814.1 hypothetical protein P153DRAFT_70755 [Dothidotthia symphoricarpi CBS 119687]